MIEPIRFRVAVLVPVLFSILGCSGTPFQEISGSAFGTYYRVVANCGQPIEQRVIDDELNRLDAIMSTWNVSSTLSHFNAAEVGLWMDVEPELVEVLSLANSVSSQTAGAFDVTIKPLTDLWGFGSASQAAIPGADDVNKALQSVGFERVRLRTEPPSLLKTDSAVVDVSALGKGFAVDSVLNLLDPLDCGDALVDIGGEIRVRGRSPLGRPWRVAIATPDSAFSGAVLGAVEMTTGAMATSGNYLNFRVVDGRTYGHVIDPRSGFPLDSRLKSVSVIAETAAFADAWATALLVLGPDEGKDRAELNDIAAIFVATQGDGDKWAIEFSSAARANRFHVSDRL